VVAAGDIAGLADLPGPDQPGGVVVVGGEAQVEADGVDQPAGRGQLGQGGRLGGADPERLLADDVAAGPQGGRGLGGVDVVGAGDVDGGQGVVGDQVAAIQPVPTIPTRVPATPAVTRPPAGP
jgi:hypothetical protein